MVCSYQRPEPWQPSYRSPMPPNVPSPEDCKDEAILYRERAAAANHEHLKKIWTAGAEVLSLVYLRLLTNTKHPSIGTGAQ